MADESGISLEGIKPSPSLSTERLSFIKSLAGWKVIALGLLFWWHGPFTRPPVDLGARTCEMLFVFSGFLVGYNYSIKNIPSTWEESFEWMTRKFIAFWPLHTACFLLTLFMSVLPNLAADVTPEYLFISAAMNLSLLQAWGDYSSVYFGFNGVSWFLSALLFCYFIAPQFLRLLKDTTLSSLLFIAFFFMRYGIEYIRATYPGQFWNFDVHVSPVVRSLEFLMGMCVSSIFMALKRKLSSYGSSHSRIFAFSALEVAVTASVIYLAITRNGHWRRGAFVLLFCVMALAFAFDEGVISRFLSLPPFQWLSKLQFEFFVIHVAVISSFNSLLFSVTQNRTVTGFLLLAITLALSILSNLLTDKLRKAFSQYRANSTG